MIGNARTYKQSKNGIAILIPTAITRTLNITPGNRIEFNIENPRPNTTEPPTHKERFKKKNPPETPEGPTIPQDIINTLLTYKQQGKNPQQLKDLLEHTSQYKWNQLPPQTQTQLQQ